MLNEINAETNHYLARSLAIVSIAAGLSHQRESMLTLHVNIDTIRHRRTAISDNSARIAEYHGFLMVVSGKDSTIADHLAKIISHRPSAFVQQMPSVRLATADFPVCLTTFGRLAK